MTCNASHRKATSKRADDRGITWRPDGLMTPLVYSGSAALSMPTPGTPTAGWTFHSMTIVGSTGWPEAKSSAALPRDFTCMPKI